MKVDDADRSWSYFAASTDRSVRVIDYVHDVVMNSSVYAADVYVLTPSDALTSFVFSNTRVVR